MGDGYSVKMGYGMHIGWAIEGAIGSFYKIDASYLSPHVNMSAKLEESTKAFGVPLLITGELHDACTAKT
jgi:class 3 adenylate cyclase